MRSSALLTRTQRSKTCIWHGCCAKGMMEPPKHKKGARHQAKLHQFSIGKVLLHACHERVINSLMGSRQPFGKVQRRCFTGRTCGLPPQLG